MTERMDRSETDAMLADAGVGVLSLADGGETYAIPESYGYDGDRIYFQFVYDADSTKISFAETTDVATLTVFSVEPPESALVRGPLERVPDADAEQAVAAIAANADIPSVDVLAETDPNDASMAFYRLVPDEYSGRTFDRSMTGPGS